MPLSEKSEFVLRALASACVEKGWADMITLSASVRRLGSAEEISASDLPFDERLTKRLLELEEKGFVKESEKRYSLTEKGKEEIHQLTDEHTSDIDDLEAYLWGSH